MDGCGKDPESSAEPDLSPCRPTIPLLYVSGAPGPARDESRSLTSAAPVPVVNNLF